MSFSNLLQDAQNAQKIKAATPAKTAASSASVMTLGLDDPMTNSNSLMPYNDEEEWTLSSKYETTEKNVTGKRYSDDNYSTVDEKKNVKIDPSQINLTQESNSQYIPFIMPRYFDGIDLMNMTLLIYYLNANGAEGWSDPINVCYNSTHIRFGWVLTDLETAIQGKLTFEIHAKGKDPLGGKYLLKTRPNSQLEVLESLHGNGAIIYDETWSTSFLDTVEGYKEDAEQSALLAGKYLNEIVDIVANAESDLTGYSKSEVNRLLDLKADLYVVENLQEDVLENTLNISNLKEHVGELPEGITSTNVVGYVQEVLLKYYTKEEVDKLFEDFDISDQLVGIEERVENLETDFENFDGLAALNVNYDETTNTLSFFNGEEKIKDIVIQTSSEEDIANALKPIEEDLQSIHDNIDNLPTTLESDYYKKQKVDELLNTKADKTDVNLLGTKVTELSEELAGVDKSPRLTYDVAYNDAENPDVGENVFVFYEIENEGQENEKKEPKQKFTIVGGSGGSGTSSSLKIEYVTKTPLVITVDDKALITYKFSGTDSSGDDVLEGNATWKVAGNVVANHLVTNGENTFDITEYLSIGSQKVQLSITDDAGSLVTKSWTVQKIDVRLESSFNDTFTYALGDVEFQYTPYGAISKEVHFVLDGKEIDTVTTSASGIPTAYNLPSQTHGSHLLEVYMTASVNDNTIESNHIFKDILWYDATTGIPVIGCTKQEFTATQYATTNIEYTVYDPSTENPSVEIAVDGIVVSTPTLNSATNIYSFKTDKVGEHIITITCGDTVKTLKANITKLDIDISPVTAGLVFDFNPSGKSNNDIDRLWTNGTVSMSVSDNFDWINGGYQYDENGDQYFCIKSGTTATIDYKLFADDAKKNGKEFKLVFKTTNVAKPDATFLSCIDNTTETNHIGIQMDVHEAFIYGQAGKLDLSYSEDDIIEFEFNISKNTEAIPMVMGYEDGVSSRPMVYDDSYSFTQTTPKVISLGSEDCDVHIYRFKVYNTSLTDRGILNNFIADARNAEEMIARYNRNQIYDENQNLNPDVLAEKCPWLRIIKLEAPYFTNHKDNRVGNTTVEHIYKNGTRPSDNWKAVDAVHSGQGTSSNNYGAAGRNLDIMIKRTKDKETGLYLNENPYFILSDNSEVRKVSLTDKSVPVNYFNIKVNIASSNNMTNALLAKKYNEFNPYNRAFIRDEDYDTSIIKDTMEFYNCVVFIKETDKDLTTHREFADNEWHFYAIGNIGDSKKTDNTRLTDMNDKYECCVEIMDVQKPLSDFPVDTMMNAMSYEEDEVTHEKTYIWAKNENLGILHEKINGQYVLTEDTEVDLNKTYYVDILEHDDFSEDFTYGWRYIWEDGSDEENEEVFNYCKQKWIELYRFITTSTDEEFKANFEKYFVLDSALYNYLFTTRYCMVDNRAKNTFWHYGKTGEIDTQGNPIRKWDLSWGYDMDTSLGLNNYGKQVYRYGLEDTDVDEKGEEIFREMDSMFFCRIRDLYRNELKSMYNLLDNAWKAESFIAQCDEWQSQFPEELWRLDINRKYIRTYNSSFINGKGNDDFLKNMANGKMKYHRRQWERNQEQYMASKYQSTVASGDDNSVVMRCSISVSDDVIVKPNYKLKLTPYAYMYLNVEYSSGVVQLRAVPNVEYEIPFGGEKTDIIKVYSASCLQSLGDLSSCYLATINTTPAVKLKELIIGNSIEGYDNPYFTNLTTGANYLLEKINVENVSGLTQSLNLSALNNLRELYAHGTNASGVTFADGGKIEIAELPAINSITMRNLLYLKDFDVVSFEKLTSLTIENCSTVDVKAILEAAPNINRARITDINWTLEDTTLLERLYIMGGFDRDGYNTERAVLTGSVYVPVIKQKQLEDYQAIWNDLEITSGQVIPQFVATFLNTDGTVLDIQYVDKGYMPVDPVTRIDNPINTPTQEPTIDQVFTYIGWDKSFVAMHEPMTFTAVYSSSIREYTIKYVSEFESNPLQITTAPYGSIIEYTGEIPVYTGMEGQSGGYVYYLFDHWDKSGYVDGNKIINAVFDSCNYTGHSYFEGREFNDLRPVEKYMLLKLNMTGDIDITDGTIIEDLDELTFKMGNDYDFEEIESILLVDDNKYLSTGESTIFTGNHYIDTGLAIMDEDRSFVIAIDFEMDYTNAKDSTLVECYNPSQSDGFKLSYNGSSPALYWSTNNAVAASTGEREMIVLRHVKGESSIHVYKSNISGESVEYVEIAHISRDYFTPITQTLVLGCSINLMGKPVSYASGTVHWAKVWYGDLGEVICTNLAKFTKEKITTQMCGYNRKILENGTGYGALSFLATHVLRHKSKMMASSGIGTTGGWNETVLKEWLNTRFYDGLPLWMKQLVKPVRVEYIKGGGSTNIETCICNIFIPSITSLSDNKDYIVSPYIDEESAIYGDKYISYMLSNEDRVRKNHNNEAVEYWTRSVYSNPSYFIKIRTDGTPYAFTTSTTELGIVIEFCM